MWWEAVPSFAIVMAALTIPHITTYVTNRLFLGNAYKRRLETRDEAHHYLRDKRISGYISPYIQVGLDCLPEPEPEPVKPACA